MILTLRAVGQTVSCAALIAGAALTAATAAEDYKETTQGASANVSLNEVVVTAERRSERLQDVPISVTALTEQEMHKLQLSDVSSLRRVAPGLSVLPYSGDNQSAVFSMRGMFYTDNLAAVDPPVGLYVDGVYIPRATGGNLGMIDIDRVEVLRGPQGTLFGRNTIGGAINIIPKKPSDRFEGWVQGSYGNFDAWNLQGVVNAPLTEDLAVRVVGSHNERGAVARSTITGQPLNNDNSNFVRGEAAYNIGSNWNLLMSGDYTHTAYKGSQWITPVQVFGTGTVASLIKTVSGGTDNAANYNNMEFNRNSPTNSTGGYDGTIWGTGATLAGTFDDITFKSIVAYRRIRRNVDNYDADGTPYQLVQQLRFDETNSERNAEFQLFGKSFDKRLDWILGAYYFRETGEQLSETRFLVPFVKSVTVTDGAVDNTSTSLYGQATYSVTERLRVTAGVRGVEDRRFLDSRNYNETSALLFASCAVPGAASPTCSVLRNARFRYVPFTTGLDYKLNDMSMIYGKFSRGYRAGGFNMRGTNTFQLTPFGPEQLDSVEVGSKTELWDRRLSINLAAYHSKYTSIQLSHNVATSASTITQVINNVGEATVDGGEAEVTGVLGNLLLSTAFSYTHGHYTSLLPGVSTTLGTPFPYTPKFTSLLGIDYNVPVGPTSMNLHLDYDYRTRTYFASVPPASRYNTQAGYGLLNAVATLTLDSEHLSFSVYGKNLGDKLYVTRTVDYGSIGEIVGIPGDPRTFGVSAKYAF